MTVSEPNGRARVTMQAARGSLGFVQSTDPPGVTHGPIIEAAMPDIFAFFARHTRSSR
jgi:hypothetical protein